MPGLEFNSRLADVRMQRVKTSLSIRMKTDALLSEYEWWGAKNKHTHRKAGDLPGCDTDGEAQEASIPAVR